MQFLQEEIYYETNGYERKDLCDIYFRRFESKKIQQEKLGQHSTIGILKINPISSFLWFSLRETKFIYDI
jgi:hypothetical protein